MLIRAIDSFLTQRRFRVNIDRTNSEWRSMLADVSQGSKPSSMFYNSYAKGYYLYTAFKQIHVDN